MNSAHLALKKYLEALPLTPEVVTDVLACFKIKYYARNDYFSFAGRCDDRLGFVVDGLFVMLVEKPEGPLFAKDFLSNGVFLLSTFEPGAEALVHIQAIKDSIVLEARYSDIQTLYSRYDDFRQLSERGMQKRYQMLCERLEQLATLDASGRYFAFRQAFASLETDIPQYLVAAFVGVTPTQLSRIRKKLKTA